MIRRNRAHIGVVSMRGDERLPARKADDYQSMVKLKAVMQIYEIPELQIADIRSRGKRTDGCIIKHKAAKIFRARPRGCAVIRRAVIPARIPCVIHYGRARIKALRGKICAISAQAVKIKIRRISAERPFFRIIGSRLPVISNKMQKCFPLNLPARQADFILHSFISLKKPCLII